MTSTTATPPRTAATDTNDTNETGIALRAHPIDPDRLNTMRVQRHDEHGNPWTPYAAFGWEPLRCCLRSALDGESIVLISYAPFTTMSPWTEVGPVYVHAERCSGYVDDGTLPPAYRTGPRVLRGYDRDRRLLYEHVRVVAEGEDVARVARELLEDDEVRTVHVRALETQCFTYAITRA